MSWLARWVRLSKMLKIRSILGLGFPFLILVSWFHVQDQKPTIILTSFLMPEHCPIFSWGLGKAANEPALHIFINLLGSVPTRAGLLINSLRLPIINQSRTFLNTSFHAPTVSIFVLWSSSFAALALGKMEGQLSQGKCPREHSWTIVSMMNKNSIIGDYGQAWLLIINNRITLCHCCWAARRRTWK